MASEMDALPESVQAAMRTMDGSAGGNRDDAYDIIRAELLRLARVCADLTFAEDCALKRANERASKLTARVQELERENGDLRSVAGQHDTLGQRYARKCEAELAAIKKRIAEARIVSVDVTGDEVWLDGDDYGGKRVALLPLDDEAKS